MSSSNNPLDETLKLWNAVAVDWQRQVGVDGDNNRKYNSDPVLWDLLGDIKGLCVLDAGCGTGYFANKLMSAGASVTAIDFSEKMIEIAKADFPTINFTVDSCTTLTTVSDASQDAIVSNYVLMDVPDLSAALRSFFRVLKPGGRAVLVFSHPCFPAGFSEVTTDDNLQYTWPFNYYDQQKIVEPPWAHFKNDFIWFHRPLSEYFRVFRETGFVVTDLREPHLNPELASQVTDPELKARLARVPFSMAFKLQRS